MKYNSGEVAHIGDEVLIANDDLGIVVFSVDTDEYSEKYPKSEWAYLKKGIMIKSKKMGLVHFEELDEDVELLKRSQPNK